ncbi:fibronectin type III domain-containing protein [Chryseobacterium sp. MMS23-Vi53]|uniref:fibronectin type III domain-containing protein n=1 Tax=Chryseobacterium sp. MMS23-Vi53 TaxID=3386644 RepID=UPI0039E8B9B2
MNLKLLFGACNVAALFCASTMMAQNYQPIPISSGFTADVVANGVGSSAITTSSDVDGVSFAFVSRDFQLNSSSTALTYGLPIDGTVNSVVTSTPGLTYKLANYNSNNSLKLASQNDTGTLVFATPTPAFKLYMLATSGSGASTVSVVVNFTDNTSQTFTGVTIADWYNATGFAIQGFGRINRTNDTLESGSGTNPRLYQTLLTIDPANQTKPIQSVTITKTSTAQGYSNIFAMSADVYSDCAPPVLNAVGTLTANSAAVSWTAAAGTSPSSYDIYYSTTNTAPTSGSTPNITGLAATSTTIPGLNSNTTYYYWVRSHCSTATSQSAWSFSGTFKTLCGPMTTMFEDFESYASGSIVPDCWARIIDTNGSQTISTATPVASGTKHIYQYSSTTQNPTTVVLPQFSNINAGTHWLRFKARVSSATGTLNVGYVTDAANSSTFVPLQALSIANTVYATAGNEYSVIVPSSVPANARLAIRNTADAKSYYYDDVYWEPKPTCFAPSALTSSNVLANSVDISWTAPSSTPGNGYEYYYSTTNTAPTAATAASGTSTSTSTTVTGLAPATTYYMWIRSACSSSDKSSWWGSVTFTTACATLAAPFAQTFDNGTAPNCWTNVNPTATTTNANLLWKFAGNADYGANLANNGRPAGSYAWVDASSPYSGAGANTVQLVTPYVNLAGLTAPYISFDWYKNHSTSTSTTVSPTTYDNNKLTVEVNDGSGWVNVWSDTSNLNQWRTVGVPLAASYVGATIQVRFTVDKNVNGNGYFYDDLLLDNVEIKQNPTILAANEVSATKNAIKIYPNPFRDVLNISDVEKVKSVVVNDISGRVVKTIENPGKELNLSELNSGMYLVTIIFKDGSRSTMKAIKK